MIFMIFNRVPFLHYCLLACQPVNSRTGSAQGGRVTGPC